MKRFVIFQALALLALGLYWSVGPKKYVAAAELTAVTNAPSENSIGNYAAAEDSQITGSIGRGFHDRRVANAIVKRHPGLGMDAAAILQATTVSINSFSRTIGIDVAASSPRLASTIAAALLEERRALDSQLWHEEKTASLKRAEENIASLESQLQQHRAALQALGDAVGDPLEREARLREQRRKATGIENLKADMTVRARQFQNMLTLLETAIKDLRAGRDVPPSSGFELAETNDTKDDGKAANTVQLISKRSSGISEAWSELLKNTTELAALNAAYGSQHPQVIAAAAMQTGSRNRLLTELLAQQEAIKGASESMKASTAWLEQEMAAIHDEIRTLSASRFNPDYVKLRQTINGLEGALRRAFGQRQMLASATLTNPPQFYVNEPPVETDLEVQPTFTACCVASQVAVMLMLWLTSPWAGPRRRFATA